MEQEKQAHYTQQKLQGLANTARVQSLMDALFSEGVDPEMVASMFLAGAVRAIEKSGRADAMDTVKAISRALETARSAAPPPSHDVLPTLDEARQELAKRLGVPLDQVERQGALAIQVFQGHIDGTMHEVQREEGAPMDPETMKVVSGLVHSLADEGWRPDIGALVECALILDPEGAHVFLVLDQAGDVAATSMWCPTHDTHHTRMFAKGTRKRFNHERYLKEGAGRTMH